jgi:Nitrile hydratase, alpha chain
MNPQEFSDQILKQVESARKYGQIIARAWDDESFKQYLFTEPKAVLTEYDVEVPDDLVILVVENSANLLYVTLPAKPSTELSSEQFKILQQDSYQFPQQTEYDKKYYQIVAKAWEDESFKQRLFTEPRTVLIEYGIKVPEELEIRFIENTANLLYITLPIKPSEELSDEELEMAVGGGTLGTAGTAGTVGSASGTAGTFGTLGTAGSYSMLSKSQTLLDTSGI